MRRNGIVRALCGALCAGLLLGACGGTSGVVVPPFAENLFGPGGGHIAAGTVDLTIPPGAFDQDRTLAVLPQPTPLPIDPSAGPMIYLPGIMCIGPLGVPLLVDGRLRFCYQASAIPAGSTEADLVLLEWDEAAGFMRVKDRFTPGVTQDLLTHCFTDVAYDLLGHVGVAVRLGPLFDLVVPAGAPLTLVEGQGLDAQSGLLLANLDGTNAGAPLPNTDGASGAISSYDGRRILYRNSNPDESVDLRVSTVADGDQVTVASDPGFDERLQSYDPTYGWVGGNDLVHWSSRFDDGDSSVVDTLWTSPGDGSDAGSPLADGPDDAYLADLRTSPDGTMILLRWTPSFEGSERLDVVEVATGDVIGFDLPLALPGTSARTPRWLPDSSGLYGIDANNQTVQVCDPDGGGLDVLYTPPPPVSPFQSFLVDFVVAPSFTAGTASSTRCAYVRVDTAVGAAGTTPSEQELACVDVLGGGAVFSSDLGALALVSEMAFQPDGARFWVDFSSFGRIGGGLETEVGQFPGPTFSGLVAFSGADASEVRFLPFSISQMDLDRSTQRVVVYQSEFPETGDFPSPGLYLLSPDLQTATPLTFSGFQVRGPARFLRSWRLTPGDGGTGTVR